MKVRIVVIGKTFQKFIKQGMDEYFSRIKKFVNLEYIELPDLKNTKNIDIAQIKSREAEIFNKYLTCDVNILLDENGKQMNSKEFATWLQEKINSGMRCIGFFVGGAYGFDDTLKKKYHTISLSRMTFSHQLVRLVFAEQLYRALTIIKSLPYHH